MAFGDNYTDEQLAAIAGVQLDQQATPSKTPNYSDEELAKIAGVQLKPKSKSFGQRFNDVLTALADNPVTDAVLSAGEGATQALADIGNIPQNLIRRGINAVTGEQTAPVYNFDVSAQQPWGENKYPRIKEGGEIATTLALPLNLGFIEKGMKAIPGSKIAEKYLSQLAASKKIAPKVTAAGLKAAADITKRGAVPGAIYGGLFGANNPNQTLLDSAKQGAKYGALLHGSIETPRVAYNLGKSGVNKLAEKYAPKLNVTSEELQRAKAIAGDLPVDIGAALDNPAYSHIYKNTLSNVPFSGVKDNMKQVIKGAEAEEQSLLDYFKGGKDADVTAINNDLAKEVKGNYEANKKQVHHAFEGVKKEADRARIFVRDLPNVQRYAQTILDDLAVDRGLNFPTHTEFDGKTKEIIEMLAEGIPFTEEALTKLEKHPALEAKAAEKGGLPAGKGGLPQERFAEISIEEPMREIPRGTKGEPRQFVKKQAEFSRADKVRKFFGRLARKHRLDEDQTLEGIFNKFEKLAQEDLENVLTGAGREDLAQIWKAGRQVHATEVMPYRKKELYQIIKGKKTPQKIADYLMSPEHQDVFMSLTPGAQKKVLHQYFTGKNGNLLRRFNSLGEEGQQRLLTPDEIKRIKRYKELNRIAGEYRPVVKKPMTGVQAADWLKAASSVGVPAAAVASAFPHVPWYLSVPAGVAAGVAFPSMIARTTSKRLTSLKPQDVEAINKALLPLTERGDAKVSQQATKALAQMLHNKKRRNI